jgi:hypothetical protein
MQIYDGDKPATSNTSNLLTIGNSRWKMSLEARRTKVLGASVSDWFTRCDLMLHKEHEPEQLAMYPEMKRYFGLATQVSGAVTSWMRDLLVNTDDLPIDMHPTDVPDLPKSMRDEINAKMVQDVAMQLQSSGFDPMAQTPPDGLFDGLRPIAPVSNWIAKSSEQLKQTKRVEVKLRAEKAMSGMYTLMRDYAYQGGWTKAHTAYLHYGNIYPYKVMCLDWLPVSRPVWKNNKYTHEYVVAPQWSAPDPRNIYFSPDATSANDGGWVIHHKRMSRATLMSLIGVEHYKSSEIEAVQRDFNTGSRQWIGQNESASNGSDDASWGNDEEIDVLRHVGKISGSELSTAGVTGYDSSVMYEVDFEWVGNRIIKCMVVKSPTGGRGYFSTSFKKLGDKWAGASPMMYLYDAQITLNQWQFMINRNFYATSGPMMEVHAGRLDNAADFFWNPYDSFTTNASAKVHQGDSSPFQLHQAQPLFMQQMSAFQTKLRWASTETNLPIEQLSSSMMGGGQTLGEITLKWSAALRGIKDSVLNDDQGVIEPTFTLLYQQLMAYEKDPSIKADALVKAKGASGLLQREMVEVQRERLMPLLQQAATANPEKYGAAMDAVLSEQFKAFDVADLLPQDPRSAKETAELVRGIPGSEQMPQSRVPKILQNNGLV